MTKLPGRRGRAAVLAAAAALLAGTAAHAAPAGAASVYLEDLTSPELRERIAHGDTTVLVPIGGTEQNGPYMVLGKHNVRARVLAGRIAGKLGHAVVAPVVAYVPEGAIHPPTAHMKYAGTISVPDAVFEGLLEATARSFKQHGFKDVFFLGDHGGYQADEQHVAARLDREWAADPSCRVHALLAYYDLTQGPYIARLKSEGHSPAEIGVHAGLADTALSLAVDPALVRTDALAHAGPPTPGDGLHGDPRKATAALGQPGVDGVVDGSVAAIRAALSSRK